MRPADFRAQSVFSEGRFCFPWGWNRKGNEMGKELDLMNLMSQFSFQKPPINISHLIEQSRAERLPSGLSKMCLHRCLIGIVQMGHELGDVICLYCRISWIVFS